MSETNRQELATLNHLIRINNASQYGFNLAGESVKNRGLKLIFKSFAQERADFSQQLGELVQAQGGEPAEGSGLLAAIHRGWINIKAAMTIGQPATEAVVLAEVSRGERAARQAYRQALEKELSAEAAGLVQRQFQSLEAADERIRQLRGDDNTRTVVRLFDSQQDADTATEALLTAGFDPANIRPMPLAEAVLVYQGQDKGHTLGESTFAGALLGMVVGLVIGLIAVAATRLLPGEQLAVLPFVESALSTLLAALAAGLLFGGFFGAIIGAGITQDDTYQYRNSIKRGIVLLTVQSDMARAEAANDIMKQVNARSWQAAAES